MAKLTSRPPVTATRREMALACQPAMNILLWLSTKLVYQNDSKQTVTKLTETLEQALACMELFDYDILASPYSTPLELHYLISMQALAEYEHIALRLVFRVQP